MQKNDEKVVTLCSHTAKTSDRESNGFILQYWFQTFKACLDSIHILLE